MINWSSITHFKESEFKHPELINADALHLLDKVRELYGSPIVVTSDARTPDHNSEVGGSSTSLHLVGCAFDIKAPITAQKLFLLTRAVLNVSQGLSVEYEIDVRPESKHIHIGWHIDKPEHTSEIIVFH